MGYGNSSVFWELVCHAGKEGITHGTKDTKSEADAKGTKASKLKKA